MPQEHRLILACVDQPGYTTDLDCYVRHGGYSTLRAAIQLPSRTLPDGRALTAADQIRKDVMDSGLRGRGGAGFSCGLKWSFVDRKSGKPIYLICNADESEPGTFKDRQILHKDPHQLIEGMILSCFANDVHLAYIYIRGEFVQGAKILDCALGEARARGFLGRNILGSGYDLEIHVHRGAGAYICGEETGLIESLEGKRPYPRIKPPYFPAILGLYLCPTIVNNVETLCAVKHVLSMGGLEYAKLGTPNNTGTRIVSISGHVRQPGYYEIEIGKVTLGELIFDSSFGGGLHEGRRLKAVIPGGSSAKVFKADERFKLTRRNLDGTVTTQEVDLAQLPYDFDSLIQAGSMSGSGAIIVLDDSTDMVAALANIAEFYAHESCGQCTPCREGTSWSLRMLERIRAGKGRLADLDLLLEIGDSIGIIPGTTICGLADGAAWPIKNAIRKFRDEFEAFIRRTNPDGYDVTEPVPALVQITAH